MDYESKFALAKTEIIYYCTQRIRNNWEKMFDMWLSMEADMEFGNVYLDTFNKYFSKYVSTKVASILWHNSNNTLFAISAFMKYNDDAILDNILEFTEIFIKEQLDNFTDYCDDISMAMYEESSECERDANKASPPQ
jgi:hypothetical protein